MTADITWQHIENPAALAELEAEWWALWARCPTATPFQSPAWLLPWWNAFAPGRLAVVTGRETQRLIAMAPLYLERSPFGTRLLPLGASITDHHDILLDPEFAAAACRGLPSYLVQNGAGWDIWEFSELAPDATALRLVVPSDCEDDVERSNACPVLPLPSDGAIDSCVPSRKRRDARMARNRAKRRGNTEIAVADRTTALPMIDALICLHGARWQSRGEAGVVADPRVQRFHRAAIPRLLHAELLRLCELRIAGDTVGVYYGLQHRERAFAYLSGFDPRYAFESPGTILIEHAINWAIQNGAREFHFLRGHEAYKYQWGAVDRWNLRRTFRRRAARAHAS